MYFVLTGKKILNILQGIKRLNILQGNIKRLV